MLSCVRPLTLCVFPDGSKTKKDGFPGRLVSLDPNRALAAESAQIRAGEIFSVYSVPCGRCLNCRRNRGFQWSRRILAESALYDDEKMAFLTLTYSDDCLPSDGLLHPEDPSSFLKVLRQSINRRVPGCSLRYFLCGEYGDQFGRPHYHLILFGYDFFADSNVVSYGDDNSPLYENPLINNAWKNKGFAVFGQVTPASINYVAGYVTKKFKQDSKKSVPPFIRMSTRPGIGFKYLLDHSDEIQRCSGFTLKGKFYRLDRDSLRFLLRQGVIDDLQADVIRLNKGVVADQISNLRDCYSSQDKYSNDLGLMNKYALDNRLWSAVMT